MKFQRQQTFIRFLVLFCTKFCRAVDPLTPSQEEPVAENVAENVQEMDEKKAEPDVSEYAKWMDKDAGKKIS